MTHPKAALPGRAARAAAAWHAFFPPVRPLPEGLVRWVAVLFPDVDLRRVDFHAGLPLVVRPARPAGVALPGLFSTGRMHVYLRDGLPDGRTVRGLALLAHEMVHVRQCFRYAGGRGGGLLRAASPLYLALYLRHGYRCNPLEKEAYAFDAQVRRVLARFFRHPPRGGQLDLLAWAGTGLPARARRHVSYTRLLARALPGARDVWAAERRLARRGRRVRVLLLAASRQLYLGAAWLLATLATLVLAVAWPVVQLLLLPAAAVAAALAAAGVTTPRRG